MSIENNYNAPSTDRLIAPDNERVSIRQTLAQCFGRIVCICPCLTQCFTAHQQEPIESTSSSRRSSIYRPLSAQEAEDANSTPKVYELQSMNGRAVSASAYLPSLDQPVSM